MIKPFATNKDTIVNKDITLIYGERISKDDYQQAKEFNEHYTDVTEKSSGTKLLKLGTSEIFSNYEKIFDEIFQSYKALPKFVKMLSEIIADPLTTAINYCLNHSLFPKNDKVASITLLDKGKLNNYEISNYRPVHFPKFTKRY